MENKQKSSNEVHSEPLQQCSAVVCRYYHPCVGYGDFVREYKGRDGAGLIIRLDNGREWFAPINEFTRVR